MDAKKSITTSSVRTNHNSDSALRAYTYNSVDLQSLFAKIIESLSSPDESNDQISRILTDVCRYFKVGCGFVYEADHTHTFHLKERYASYAIRNLPESFTLETRLSADEMQERLRTSVFCRQGDGEEKKIEDKELPESNTFMLVPVLDKDGDPIGLVGMMDRRRKILLDEQAVGAAKMVLNLLANNIKTRIYQRGLEYAQQSLVSILDNTGVDIYVNDFNTHEVLYVNKSMAAPYGGRENMLGKQCWATIYTDKDGPCEYCPQKKLIDDEGNPTKIYSWDYRRPFDGSWFRVLSAAFRWVDGRLAHVISSVDITENKNNEATIAQMANYDDLTNLPNRRKLDRDCREFMENAAARKTDLYLLFFDLDNFKKLNDSMGHQAGDELLTEIGKALQKNPLTKNCAYRYGGDEFVILLSSVKRDYVRKVIAFLLERFAQPWELTGTAPVCRASIGVASYPIDASTPDELVRKADMMMYQAKKNGRDMACFFDGEVMRREG